MNDKTLYEKIRDSRKAIGISQAELASLLNVSRQTISNWEKGITVPDAKSLERVADLLHVSVESLLGDIDRDLRDLDESRHPPKAAERGTDLNNEEIAVQLSRINELYAEKILRDEEQKETLKRYAHYGILLFLVLALLFLLMPFIRFWYMSARTGVASTAHEETEMIGEP